MSQTKAQLIQPIGVVTASGVVVSGVMTAGTFDGDIVGSATSIIQGKNLNVGAFNASSFAGDFTGNATGIITSSAIKVGQLTASSFVGDFTGTATSMAKGTGFKAGTVTATPANVTYTVTVGSKTGGGNAFYLDGIEAPTPSLYPGATYTFDQSAGTNATHPLRFATAADAAGSTEYTFQVTTNGTPGNSGAWTKIVVSPSAPDTLYYYCTNHSGMGDSINITNLLQGPVTGAVTGDVKGNISGNITGDVTGNAVGAAASVLSGANIHVGVMTATSFYGDGSNLTGIAATNFNTQTVTANSGTTAIDLSAGNVIKFNQSSNTTVSFANTSEAMSVTLIRDKDDNTTARTISWPASVKWNGGSAPTLISSSTSGDKQQFQFLTRDSGVTWYAWEPFKYDVDYHDMYAWGDGADGKLGLNNQTDRSSPTQVGTDTTWSVKLGNSGTNTGKAIKTDGTLWSWGTDSYGQNGKNNETAYSSPIQIGTNTNWSNVANTAAMQTAAVTKTDGSLWVWGKNHEGQLGLNSPTNTHRSSPTQLPGTWHTGLHKISTANPAALFGIKSDGTLWGMGWSSWFGFSNPAGKVSSPCQIGSDNTWDKLAGGSYYITATKTDGTIWSWGHGSAGQLGQNNTTQYSSPRQIGSNTTWDRPFGAQDFSGALKTDGTLWLWGKNSNGQLGQNNTTNYSSPKQVPGSYIDVCGGGLECSAIKSDGTLWFWGQAGDGQNGDNIGNGSLKYSSPIQVGTSTDWKKISAVIVRGRLGLRLAG